MAFTRVDRNLLVRVAQQLREEAEICRRSHQPWTQEAESRKQKARFDRLVRDSGDLDALRRRMEQQFPDMIKLMPLVEKAPAGVSGG